MELGKLNEVVKKPVDEMTSAERWALFLKYASNKRRRDLVNKILAKEEGVALAGAELMSFSKDEIELFRKESEYKYAVDLQSKIVSAKRKESKKWQGVVAEKDAELADVKAENADMKTAIAELQERLQALEESK